jgi:hypothetical protein
MSQIGQSYLPDGIGFGIGVIGMAAFIIWQWRGRMRRQALGLATTSSGGAVGRQTITCDIAGVVGETVVPLVIPIRIPRNASMPARVTMKEGTLRSACWRFAEF